MSIYLHSRENLISICEMVRDRHSFLARGVGIVNELNALRRRTLSGINNCLPIDISHERSETAYVVRKRFVETDGRLDFIEINAAPVLHKQIDLKPPIVPHKVHVRLKPPVEARLENVSNDHVLENAAEHGIAINLRRLADAEQMATDADIREINFRRLDEPLAEIAIVARQLTVAALVPTSEAMDS